MSAVIIVGVVLVIVFVALTLFGKKRPKNSPPIAKVGMPIIGNYVEFAKNPCGFMNKCLNKVGPIFTVPMLHKNLTFLLGPEVSAPFFRLGDDKMSQPEVYGFMTPVFGKGVVYDAEPKKRIQQYQSMAHGLKSNRLKAYVPKIEMEVLEYMKSWGESGTMNMLEALSELTILTSSRCLHGDDVREELFAEISKLYHDLDQGVTPLSFFFPYAPIAAHRARDHARKELVNVFSKVIAKRREQKINSENTTDILQIFIDLLYKDGTSLNDDQIVGLLIALLFAGQHTSSITSTWVSFLLCHNPECMAKALAEQEEVLGARNVNTPLDFEAVGNMKYLENVVKETLRMYPPLIMLMRMAMADIETTVDGKKYIIPKGDIVVTSPAVASRMPSVFTNPDTFDPDRFGPTQTEHKVPFAYLGFGGGMHACMGQQFGILQVKTIVSLLLRNYTFEPVDKELPEPDFTAMVVGPYNHLMVRYTKRHDATI